jgi:hypothetical protein
MNLMLMARIDEQFLETPFFGVRQMAVTGRDILRWLAEDYILTDVRTDFEALLEATVNAADDWLTSTNSLGLRKRAQAEGTAHIIDFRPVGRLPRI